MTLISGRQFLNRLFESAPMGCRGPIVVAIDGRSGSGKSTLAGSLAALRGDVCVVASDDIAWHHSFFDWADAARTHLLTPLRTEGGPLEWRPVPWMEHGRPGSIVVPRGTAMVLFEGVGTGRTALSDSVDLLVWVDVDEETSRRRLRSRGGSNGEPENPQFVEDWLAQEELFLAQDRPWTRAQILVDGATSRDDNLIELSSRRQ